MCGLDQYPTLSWNLAAVTKYWPSIVRLSQGCVNSSKAVNVWTNAVTSTIHLFAKPSSNLFHRAFIVRGKSCGQCFLPVPQLDEEGNVRQDYVDPCVYAGLHLHHPSMRMSHDDYIKPALLPLTALPFDTRMGHYKIIDLQCAGCHDQDDNLKQWTIPDDAVSRILEIFYHPPDDEWIKKKPLVKMDEIVNGKLQAWEEVCHRHRLESTALIAPVSFEVLECLVYTTPLATNYNTWLLGHMIP